MLLSRAVAVAVLVGTVGHGAEAPTVDGAHGFDFEVGDLGRPREQDSGQTWETNWTMDFQRAR